MSLGIATVGRSLSAITLGKADEIGKGLTFLRERPNSRRLHRLSDRTTGFRAVSVTDGNIDGGRSSRIL